jgi:hypothetical protein
MSFTELPHEPDALNVSDPSVPKLTFEVSAKSTDDATKKVEELTKRLEQDEEKVQAADKILLQRRVTTGSGDEPDTISGFHMGIDDAAAKSHKEDEAFGQSIDDLLASAEKRLGVLNLSALKDTVHTLNRDQVDARYEDILDLRGELIGIDEQLLRMTAPNDAGAKRIKAARDVLAARMELLSRMMERLAARSIALPTATVRFNTSAELTAFFESHPDLEGCTVDELAAARDAIVAIDESARTGTDRIRLQQIRDEVSRRRSALLVPGAQVVLITRARTAYHTGRPTSSVVVEQWYREDMNNYDQPDARMHTIPGGIVRGELVVRQGRWFIRDYQRSALYRLQPEEREQLWHEDEFTNGPNSWTSDFPEIRPPVTAQAQFLLDSRREVEERASLSRDDYLRHFGNSNGNSFESVYFRQGNDGNCFLIASLYQIFQSEHCEAFIRTSVSISGDGFDVVFPLGSPRNSLTSVKVHVSRSEMEETLHVNGVNRRSLESSHDGWVALETAYTKQFRTARGPTNGGVPSRTLNHLLHGTNTVASRFWKSPALAQEVLRGFTRGRDFLCAGTPERDFAGELVRQIDRTEYRRNTFPVGRYRFLCGHAYTIVGVDLENNVIDVRNPHDTRTPMLLTLQEFAEAFDNVTGTRIDYSRSMYLP